MDLTNVTNVAENVVAKVKSHSKGDLLCIKVFGSSQFRIARPLEDVVQGNREFKAANFDHETFIPLSYIHTAQSIERIKLDDVICMLQKTKQDQNSNIINLTEEEFMEIQQVHISDLISLTESAELEKEEKPTRMSRRARKIKYDEDFFYN